LSLQKAKTKTGAGAWAQLREAGRRSGRSILRRGPDAKSCADGVSRSQESAHECGHNLALPMTQIQTKTPRRLYIRGLTTAGRTFRPSDWAERLAGAMSSFRPRSSAIGAHIGYSPYCVPRVVDGVKCVFVSEALKDIEPMAWDFVMNFARDNELQVVDCEPDAAAA
jgi:hypothetical protein